MAARKDVEVDIDLDALSVARGETKATKTFRYAGHVFTVPPKFPLYVGLALRQGRIRDSLVLWLGDKQEEVFSGLGMDEQQLADLIEALYGMTPGESSASSTS